VFLTLSAESNSAKETLPKVSYIKAIDIWFGFTASFIFGTMLQALAVIRLEYLSREKVFCIPDYVINTILQKKMVEEKGAILGVDKSLRMLAESKRLHNWGRFLDELFKVLYPVIFIVFLIIYGFVVIQGTPNCV
jgi:glycine receptor